MSNLEKRMRAIMRREQLTYQQVSTFADVSTQAVHKWLSSGNISDSKARVIARNIGVDWLWLKHGISRLPMDTFYDIVSSSTANIVIINWDNFEIIAAGQHVQNNFDYPPEEVIGQSVMNFLTKVNESEVRHLQKLLYALSNMANYSHRVTFQDKYDSKPLLVRGRGTTTDNEGNTYSMDELQQVTANGTEDSPLSFRLHKKSPFPLAAQEAKDIIAKYPEFAWLQDFLKNQ